MAEGYRANPDWENEDDDGDDVKDAWDDDEEDDVEEEQDKIEEKTQGEMMRDAFEME